MVLTIKGKMLAFYGTKSPEGNPEREHQPAAQRVQRTPVPPP